MPGKHWSSFDEDALVLGLHNNVSYLKIGRMLGRTTDSIRNKAFQMGLARPAGTPWYEGLRIGFMDIETSNFEADAGSMLSWSIKMRNGALLSDCVTREEEISCAFDKRIVTSLLEALKGVDVVVTYYGTGFDNKYLKTRALMLGLVPPGAGDLYHWDVYYTVRYKLKLHRNSLDSACAAFGIEGKTHLDLPIWNRARVGDEDALKYVLQHNRQDVRILEKLFGKVERLAKWQRKPF